MNGQLFKINCEVPIYYAGDDSGILIFSPLSATTLRLSFELKPALESLQSVESFEKAFWDEQMSAFDSEAANHVWQNLVSNKVVLKVAMDEG